MKHIFLFCISLIFVCVVDLSSKEIKSSKSNGNWDASNTWIGGEIPCSRDTVIIQGKVISGDIKCAYMEITEDGFLEVAGGTTFVEGVLENRGEIKVNENSTLKVFDLKNKGIKIHNCGIIEVGQ